MPDARTTPSFPDPEPAPVPWWAMTMAVIAVGVIAGGGAVVFRAMIAAIHNLFFLGSFSFTYDANAHTPASPFGAFVALSPVVGALGVAYLVKTFAPEAKGHGVPEVMSALHYHNGVIRPVVAGVKSLASALSIGSGGSVGREGPIIQIGSAFGSTVGQVIAMPLRQRAILIAAGAGGGIAATFNTPIGGIVFAIELMLPVTTSASIAYVAISCVIATAIGRASFGPLPPLDVPGLALAETAHLSLADLPWYVPFGLVIGLAAAVMTRSIYWFEDCIDRMPGNYYTRHATAMGLVGLLMLAFMTFSSSWFGQPNHYYVQGVGYATLMDVLSGSLSSVGFLLLLAVAKWFATCLTLGSGASGGVFSPCLFLGATIGGAFGGMAQWLFPDIAPSPVHFAIAGMAGMIGGTTGAMLTGTIMTFEMTRDYTVALPIVITVALATAIRSAISRPTIYTLKLLRRGEIVPQGLQGWRGELRVGDVMTSTFQVCSANAGELSLIDVPVVVVASDGQIEGVRVGGASTAVLPCAVLDAGDSLYPALRRMAALHVRVGVVCAAGASPVRPIGVLTDRELAALARRDAHFAPS